MGVDRWALIQISVQRKKPACISRPGMATNDCTGYHWSQGQYVLSSCSQESSTFFVILGFTMLVLVMIVLIIIVIACVRRQRLRTRTQQTPSLASQENEDDCVINLDGLGRTGEPVNGRNLENVKTVIMAGEEKPTYIAHLVPPRSASPSSEPSLEEEPGVNEEGAGVNEGEPTTLAVVSHEEV